MRDKDRNMMKRKIPYTNGNRNGGSKDDVYLPFHSKQWRYLKTLVMDDNINQETSKKIIDLLIAMEQRDTAEGRLGLALTYEIYNAFYHLHKLNRNNNTEGAALQSVLACALQRSVNHLHDVYGHLEGGPSSTYRNTMEYFRLPGIIATYRNDIAHGKYPTVDKMVDAMIEIRKVVISNYWKPFQGDMINLKVEDGRETLFADFVRKSRVFLQSSSRLTEEDERLLKEMTLKSIENDFNYFGESFFSTSFVIEDVDGCCFKALPSPIPYVKLNVMKNLSKFVSTIYHPLNDTGHLFYLLIHGFQSIVKESNELLKERKIVFFSFFSKEIIKLVRCFSICETIQLIKWEVLVSLPGEIFSKLVYSGINKERIAEEIAKLMDKDGSEGTQISLIDGVSRATSNKCKPWGKIVIDKYKNY